MTQKKAQLKTGETIIVLIIFFILLAGGMVFYAKIQLFTGKQDLQEAQELDAIAVEQRVRHLAEIPCTVDATVVFDCYDLSKIEALQETIADNSLYYSSIVFKNSGVVVTSVYPTSEEVVLYEYPYAAESSGAQPFRTPVTLYDPVTDSYSFGYITIEVYS
ncbi:hypothetical protein HZC31_02240 [Candidatus Woesearchaeota archaeon]|nr:hypothetical protein [Candidatus Woesearchaeota archaeon]